MATSPNPIQQTAPPTPQTPDAPDTVSLPDERENAVKGSQNLARAFSRLNERLRDFADSTGVRRSVTVPHLDGQGMDEHVKAVGQAVAGAGGLTKTLLIATHSKHAADGGSTVGYNADQLRQQIIPKDDEKAKAAIDACNIFVAKCASLLGNDDPTVKTAKSQLDIVGRSDGQGMTAKNLIVALLNICAGPIQAVARAHSFHKHGAAGHPALTAPRQ